MFKKFYVWAAGAFILFSACSKEEVEPSFVHTSSINNTYSIVSADSNPIIPQVDKGVIDFMSTYRIPGVSIAITKEGKLVYAKSFGKADIQANTAVTNENLFRIASVSKSVTAVAIMKLVESGKLSLDAKVFGEDGILGKQYGKKSYHPYILDITIRHLLQHTAGGWPNGSKDPMYANPTMTTAQLISWVLDNRPLVSKPGTSYDYSNFGYCLLGRVIEKISGQSYEQYVKSTVLQPCGITQMQIAGNTEADRKQNEVKYYEEGKYNPYAYNISRMDAHGGWIASATDLARFLVRVDGFYTKSDILSELSISTMTTPSVLYPNYALGWNVNYTNNWWHVGTLPGSASEIVRTSNGFTWVVLCNGRSRNADFCQNLDKLVWQIMQSSTIEWPDMDLFESQPIL